METCSICLNEVNGNVEVNGMEYKMECCKNSFHRNCIAYYSQLKKYTSYFKCPLCRQIQYKINTDFDKLIDIIILNENEDYHHYKNIINLQDINGDTILIYAIKQNLEDVIFKILKIQELDINIQNILGDTALILAIKNSSTRIINKILDIKEIDINIQNIIGYTPLMYYLNEQIIYKILQMEPDINIQNNVGNTPLMISLMRNLNETIINKFLEIEQDINAQNMNGYTALMYALKNSYSTEIINKILNFKGINVNLKDYYGNTALIYAIKYNMKFIYKILKLRLKI